MLIHLITKQLNHLCISHSIYRVNIQYAKPVLHHRKCTFNELYPGHHDVEHPGDRRHIPQHSHPAVVAAVAASQAGQELGQAVRGELVVTEERLGQRVEERVVLQEVDMDQEPLVILGVG